MRVAIDLHCEAGALVTEKVEKAWSVAMLDRGRGLPPLLIDDPEVG